jgi:hypothetical protein
MSDINATIISGTIATIGQVETVGAKQHKKQIVAVDTGGQYPQTIGVEFFGKNQPLVDNLNLQQGDRVRIHCNINGRESNGRYYVSLSAWKVENDNRAAPPTSSGRPASRTDDPLPF